MSPTPTTRWLWSQPRTVTKTETRIVVNNQGLLVLTCHEKEQDLSGEEEPGGDRAALFCENHITVQCRCRNVWQEAGMDSRVGLRSLKTPEAHINTKLIISENLFYPQ